MSITITLDEAQAKLKDLVHQLAPGDEIIITENQQTVAKLISEGMVPGEELVLTVEGEPKAVVTKPIRTTWPCQPGTAKDTTHWMSPDFDAPLEDFAEYME